MEWLDYETADWIYSVLDRNRDVHYVIYKKRTACPLYHYCLSRAWL